MKIAKVVANPYAALAIDASDEDAIVGIPQGVVGMPAARNVWLGARLDGVKSARTGKNHFYFPLDRHGKRRVIEIDVSDANVRTHIARAILDGSLIAADPKTAKLVGLSEKETLEVEKALEAEKAKALEELQARYGKSATLDKVPVEAEGDDEQKEPAAPAAKKLTANLRIEEGK